MLLKFLGYLYDYEDCDNEQSQMHQHHDNIQKRSLELLRNSISEIDKTEKSYVTNSPEDDKEKRY